MIALSIQQPWAWTIIHGGKDVENRTWPTKFRGRFLVHASRKFDWEGFRWLDARQHISNFSLPVRDLLDKGEFRRGGIIGSVELIDCVQRHNSPWFYGPYGYVLKDPEPQEFRTFPGRLGFFEIPTQPSFEGMTENEVPWTR